MNAKLALTCTVAVLCVSVGASSDAVVAQGPAQSQGQGQAQGRSLAMLDRLESGRWELRRHDEPGAPRRLCQGDGRRLIQLRHPGQNCSRIVVEDTDSEVTVKYTCPGQGYGRTQIRRESDSLVQVDTQGIAQGLPFAYVAEARRVGRCGA